MIGRQSILRACFFYQMNISFHNVDDKHFIVGIKAMCFLQDVLKIGDSKLCCYSLLETNILDTLGLSRNK